MKKELSFKGREISLANVDEKYLKKSDYDRYLENIKFKGISMGNIHVRLLIKLNNSNQTIGYIMSYDYNKTDQHIKIDCDIDEEYRDKFLSEAIARFCDYLYTYFPIKKIYFEDCNINGYNTKELLEKINFRQEARLKEDTFYNNKYYDKNIFTLDVNDFFEVNYE